MMGLLDSYQESTDTALNVMASRPLEADPPKPKHSAWTTPFRAVAAGAAEVAGNLGDVGSAYAKNVPTPMFGQADPASLIDAAKDFERDTGPEQFRNQVSQDIYQFGRDLRPDPLTAGTAENLVFGLTKGLTKAIGAAATLGPVGGAAAFGASEGMTAAEDLAEQGVDQTTRAKVGAVTGAMNAAGVLLPVAGKTLAQTVGLVIAGGPASFVAQQAATREILRSADYGAIAEQYDPLDPVGLAVATLVPAGFAAYAKRGGFAKSGTKQPFAESGGAESGTPADISSIAATPEAMDAAMVQNLTVARDAHQAVMPDQLPAMFGADEAQATAPLPTVKDSLTVQPDTGIPASESNQDVTPDAYRARVDTILKDQPDLVARLDESGQPVKLSDELAQIRKLAQEGTDTDFGALDAPLLKVAAECALSIGTAGL